MNRFYLTCLVLTILCAGVLDVALAEEVRGSGEGVYVQESLHSFNLPHGGIAQRTTSSGFILADDPGNPLHRINQNCSGTGIASSDGRNYSGSGYCDMIDASGAWPGFGAVETKPAVPGALSMVPGNSKASPGAAPTTSFLGGRMESRSTPGKALGR